MSGGCKGGEAKPSVSQLVIKAITILQRKNGSTGSEIANFIAKKRCMPVCAIEEDVNFVLEKATQQGIISLTRGLYRIATSYEDKIKNDDGK